MVVRVAGIPLTASTQLAVSSVLTAEWIGSAGLRHPVTVIPAATSTPEPPAATDIHVELSQHIVIQELPGDALLVRSAARVVLDQDGARQVTEWHDERVVNQEHNGVDLVIEQGDGVHISLDEEGHAGVELAGTLWVTTQPGDPTDTVPEGSVPEGSVPEGSVPEGSVPEGSVVVVQDQDLMVTEFTGFPDETADATAEPHVVGDLEQSVWALDSTADGDADHFSVVQDQTRADLPRADPFVLDPFALHSVAPHPGTEPVTEGLMTGDWDTSPTGD